MKIGILVGSLRKDSYNMKVAEYIESRYKDKADFKIISIKDIPLFNEDLEENPPEGVVRARKEVKEQDGIIFVTAEYNHSISGVMKNTLDWFSRDDYVLMRKPYIAMGASDGTIGTTRAQAHLRQVVNSGAFKMYSMSDNEFLFARIQDNIDEEGNITNEGTIRRLDKKIDKFIKFVEVINTNM